MGRNTTEMKISGDGVNINMKLKMKSQEIDSCAYVVPDQFSVIVNSVKTQLAVIRPMKTNQPPP